MGLIKILNADKQTLHLVTQVKDFYIESELETADKIIHFLMPKQNEASVDLKQENYLQTKEHIFVIKEINYKEKDYVEVFGKLDTDDLKSTIIRDYESVRRPLTLVMSDILPGTGWTYEPVDLPNTLRTIRIENKTAYEIIMDAMNLYNYEIEFDTINKRIRVAQQLGANRGSYLHSDLNIKRTEFQSDTYDFRTRLYPYGKDGMTIADVNDGKEYVSNNVYSNKIIEEVWIDDRYTDAESLKADAIARLDKMARPRLSYVVDVVYLTKLNPIYSILDFKLGDTVKIIDKDLELIDSQRVVKLLSYPLAPEKNKVHLGDTQLKFKSSEENVGEIAEKIAGEKIEIVRTELMEEIERTNALIGSAEKGYIVTRRDANGVAYEQLIMDTDDVATASKIWRWNMHGLAYSSTGYNGEYRTAITAEGRISADFVTTGTLNAALIKAGLLMSVDGSSWINMETGDFNFKDMIKFENGEFNLTLDQTTIDDISSNIGVPHNIILSNEYQAFTVSNDERAKEYTTIETDIETFIGTKPVNATIGTVTLQNSSGDTITVGNVLKDNPTKTKPGNARWVFTQGTLVQHESGWLRIPITFDGSTYIKKLKWSRILDGKDGTPGTDGEDGAPGVDGLPGISGKDGVNAKLIDIIPSATYFIRKKVSSGYTVSPSTITMQVKLQNSIFSKWEYSLNSVNWTQITRTATSSTLPYFNNTTKTLTIPRDWSVLNNNLVNFRATTSTGEMDTQSLSVLYDVDELETRVNTAETKITPQAITSTVNQSITSGDINVATASSVSEVKQTADQVTLDFRNLRTLNGTTAMQGGRTRINRDGIRVTHTGLGNQYSEMRADGFVRKWESGESVYLNDIYAGTYTHEGSMLSSPNYSRTRIDLPERFRNRDVEIILSITEFELPKRVGDSTESSELILKLVNRNMNPHPPFGEPPPPYIDVDAGIEHWTAWGNKRIGFGPLTFVIIIIGK